MAATAVVLFHFNQRMVGLDLPRYFPFVDHYYLGVDLFFILSGFILAHVHGADFTVLTPSRAVRFYILRLARIYPVHVTVLAIYLVLFLGYDLVGRHLGIGIRLPGRYSGATFFAQLFLVAPSVLAWNFPAWSVSAEWFVYLWFPLLAFTLMRASTRRSLGVLLAVIAGFAVIYGFAFHGSMNHLGLVRVIFEFSAGYLLYRTSFAAPLRLVLPALLGALLVAAGLLSTRFADFGVVLVIGALVAITAHGRSAVARHPLSRPLLWLGEISYSLYMVQSLVLAAAGRLMAHMVTPLSPSLTLAIVALLLLADILAAALLYQLVETPARDWLRDWLTRRARSARARFRITGLYETPG